MAVSWAPPRRHAVRIDYYQVWHNGAVVRTKDARHHLAITGLTNGVVQRVRVRGVDRAPSGLTTVTPWSSVSADTPSGAPGAPTAVAIDGDGPTANPAAVLSWANGNSNGAPIIGFQVRRNGASVVACTPVAATACRVSLPVGQLASYSVRSLNRGSSASDGWGPWSAASASVVGANAPGPVQNLRIVPTGSSGQARVTFEPADIHGASSVAYYSSVTGSTPIGSGTVVSGLPDGAVSAIQVWAVSTANGKSSDPAPAMSATVNPFGPCTASVSALAEHYDSVDFAWSVVSHGRSCAWAFSDGVRGGPQSGSATGIRTVPGTTGGQARTLSLSSSTVVSAIDPVVGLQQSTATAHTWTQAIDWGDGGPGCTMFSNCHWASLRLFHFKPNSTVYCEIDGTGGPDWQASYTVDADGAIYVPHTWQYTAGAYDPNRYDGTGCYQQ